jgi:diguanylate cyclase (GGDEF)-like protein
MTSRREIDNLKPDAPEQELTHVLAVELFKRTGVSSAVGMIGVGIMAYPHIATTPWQTIAGWAALMVMIFFARILTSHYALLALASSKREAGFIGLETFLCAALGLGWGLSVYVFDSMKMDAAFFMRLMILAAAMAFILSSTSIFVRIFLAYTLTISITVVAFIYSHNYVQPQGILALSVILYMAMILASGISTNRRIRTATIDHIAVVKLTEELNKALETERSLRETISQSAITDELTGVLNRRGLIDTLEKELTRCRRYKSPLSVLMIDIDFFKRINDTYGHACGDTAIRAVTESVQKRLRDSDTLGRFGGEEFVATLPAVDRGGALVAAQRVRECVEAADLNFAGGPVKITVSIGVSFFRKDDDSGKLLARADAALYTAKHNGRNRVECEDA